MPEKPKEVILPKPEPHTIMKHAILRKYLSAWFPILTNARGFPKVIYIDGFAGPGIYDDNSEGSPIIAIKAALNSNPSIKKNIDFIFIEKESERFNLLDEQVKKLKPEKPENFKYITRNNQFAELMPKIISGYNTGSREDGFKAAFTFIDPFGYGGVPLALIKQIMLHKSCEVLITFMYQEINRFLGVEESDNARNELFGTDDWKIIKNESDPKKRKQFLHDLYQRQLIDKANIKYVRSFQMKNLQNSTDFFLFFGTNRQEGLREMKRAMWAADETGTFTFSDNTKPNQTVMFGTFNPQDLKDLLIRKYKGTTVQLAEVKRYVLEETPFRDDAHLKTSVLALMRGNGELEVVDTNGYKRTTRGFSEDSMLIKFI